MREFAYRRADDVPGAVALLGGDPDARYLGGGTNLVDLMKTGVERPARLVDVRRLPLDRIEPTDDGGLRIGATVTNSDLAAHPEVRRRYPALAQAVLAGASGQLRNMATVGGNLLQRTRCGYFTDVTAPCNKRDPGSGCPAVSGEHRNHAVLGASDHCVAVHPSDMGVALAAFDAVVSYETADGPGQCRSTASTCRWVTPRTGETAVPGRRPRNRRHPGRPRPVAARSRHRKVRGTRLVQLRDRLGRRRPSTSDTGSCARRAWPSARWRPGRGGPGRPNAS
ncbi:oxidoreductase [Streptomyces viridosporus ATCC 14672]|uniref:Oxidoreductase n=1 Tax=Streptomyces viridosporus (strain ATCC 14672 / DSM 40746 / JCM 4963 / KCTC 9882 / NRRL B-12104 / FH 1290) TaxID=566461 RepID=D6A041_STRV1|nr:oxidoreductase [Streptomyces viridosporus ATCC 14672]